MNGKILVRGIGTSRCRPCYGRTERGGQKLIKTYGCQMNVYDSQRMADTLAPSAIRRSTARMGLTSSS